MVVFGRVLDQLAPGEIGSCQDGGRREDEARLREFGVRKGGTKSPTESNFDIIFRYTHAKWFVNGRFFSLAMAAISHPSSKLAHFQPDEFKKIGSQYIFLSPNLGIFWHFSRHFPVSFHRFIDATSRRVTTPAGRSFATWPERFTIWLLGDGWRWSEMVGDGVRTFREPCEVHYGTMG